MVDMSLLTLRVGDYVVLDMRYEGDYFTEPPNGFEVGRPYRVRRITPSARYAGGFGVRVEGAKFDISIEWFKLSKRSTLKKYFND